MTSDDLKKTAKDIAGSAQDAAARGGRSTRATTSSVADAASDAAGHAADTAQDLYARAQNGVAGMTDALPGSAREAVEAGRRVYNKGGDQIAQQIAKQPIEALLLAGAIGYLVGWAANRS